MADFQPALQATLRFEGGYANIAADAGGETYCGISRRNWPDNSIWPMIGACSPPLAHGGYITGVNAAKVNSLIADFYQTHYWDVIRGNDITSQSVAAYLFDWSVTSGNIAVQQVQVLLKVGVDGHVGPQTLAAINGADAQTLWLGMVNTRIARAEERVKNNPGQQQFLKGWLIRFRGIPFNG